MTVSAPTSRPASAGRQFLEGMVGLGAILLLGAYFFTDLLSPTVYASQMVGKHWTVPVEARGFGCRSWEDVQAVRREVGIGKDSSIRLLGDKMTAGQCVHLKTGMSVLITETGFDRFRFRTPATGMTEFWAPKR
jgi:hypothetical protein